MLFNLQSFLQKAKVASDSLDHWTRASASFAGAELSSQVPIDQLANCCQGLLVVANSRKERTNGFFIPLPLLVQGQLLATLANFTREREKERDACKVLSSKL